MIIKPKDTCLVLDLDDTLYKEYDYQTSGLKYVEKQIFNLYGIDFNGELLKLRDKGVSDIFFDAANTLKLPSDIKDSLLMMYRYHYPDIKLTQGTKKFILHALKEFKQVAILSDGRSITQRLKLKALGLEKIPVFLSEEWSSVKPDNKRFVAIMKQYNQCNQFCYIADNLSKDFIAPNSLKWISLCLYADKRNVHVQDTRNIEERYLPNYWIQELNEVFLC